MTVASLVGCALTAYGPAFSVFLLYVARNAQMVILMISSSFFWLISILLASIVWYIVSPLQGTPTFTIAVSVLFQEIFRYCFWLLLKKAENGLNLVSENPGSPLNRPKHAFVCGLGFGLMSGLITYVTQLSETNGPGILECNSCPQAEIFFISAVTTCLFIFLHVTWNMVAFHGWFNKGSEWQVIWVIATHAGASYGTLLIPSSISGGCIISIMICIVILIATAGLAIKPVLALKPRT